MLTLSPNTISSDDKTIEESFSAGTDSPVKADSSTLRFTDSISLKSAGMYLPASIITISPTTTSSEGISLIIPSLFTTALGVDKDFKASKAFSALLS